MQPTWNILHAILHCNYKAWQISRSGDEQVDIRQDIPISFEAPLTLPITTLTATDKLVLTALCQGRKSGIADPILPIDIQLARWGQCSWNLHIPFNLKLIHNLVSLLLSKSCITTISNNYTPKILQREDFPTPFSKI